MSDQSNMMENIDIDEMLNLISQDDSMLKEAGKFLGQDPKTINELSKMIGQNKSLVKSMLGQKNTSTKNKEKKIGPNEKCPCKSGKKYKKCCYKIIV